MATTFDDLKNMQTFGVARVKELMRLKDNIIHDKKAEIFKLREEGSNILHLALQGLLRDLPPPGPWNKKDKDRFIKAFIDIVDLIYPSK